MLIKMYLHSPHATLLTGLNQHGFCGHGSMCAEVGIFLPKDLQNENLRDC